MNVLMITGDRKLLEEGSNAHERLALQRSAVERLQVVYWGRGAFFDALRVRGEYDVVTAQDPLWRGLVGLFLAHKLGAKLNVQVHMDLHALSFVRHVLAQIVLRHADAIRVVSEKIRAQVEAIGVRGSVHVLPVYVEVQKFRSVVRRVHEGNILLWLGRFEKEKNPLAAVGVIQDVLKKVPDARLILLGSGRLYQQLVERTRGLPVEIVHWQDPTEFLAIADVVLCTSLYESWGSSIVEALSAGVPVVAPDVGIAQEAGARVVERGRLAEAVVDVLKSGERGNLRLNLLPAEEWAVQWRHSLI